MSVLDLFYMICDCMDSAVSVMKSIEFLGVPLFYWSLGFILMGIVITGIVDVVRSPYVETTSHSRLRDDVRQSKVVRRSKGGK